eukprot:403358555
MNPNQQMHQNFNGTENQVQPCYVPIAQQDLCNGQEHPQIKQEPLQWYTLKIIQLLVSVVTLILSFNIAFNYDQHQVVVLTSYSFFTIAYHAINGESKVKLLEASSVIIAYSSTMLSLVFIYFIYSLVNYRNYGYYSGYNRNFSTIFILNEAFYILSAILFMICVRIEKKHLMLGNELSQNTNQYQPTNQAFQQIVPNQFNQVQIPQSSNANPQMQQQLVYPIQQVYQGSHSNVNMVPQSQQQLYYQPVAQQVQFQNQPLHQQMQYSMAQQDNQFQQPHLMNPVQTVALG